jgi:hypothetical protein
MRITLTYDPDSGGIKALAMAGAETFPPSLDEEFANELDGIRDVKISKVLNPKLQNFDQWLNVEDLEELFRIFTSESLG